MNLVYALREVFGEVPGHDGRGAFYLPLTGRMIHIRKKGKRYFATVENVWEGGTSEYKARTQSELLEKIAWAFLQELDLQIETHVVVRNFLLKKIDIKYFRDLLEKHRQLFYEDRC